MIKGHRAYRVIISRRCGKNQGPLFWAFDRSNSSTQARGSFSITLCNKNTFLSRKKTIFFWLIGAYHYRNGHLFCVFFFGFQSRFSSFRSLNRFLPTVTAIIDQSIRDNFHHILHAKSYQIIPGFAHLHPKMTSQWQTELKKSQMSTKSTVFFIAFQNWGKTNRVIGNLSPGTWRAFNSASNDILFMLNWLKLA